MPQQNQFVAIIMVPSCAVCTLDCFTVDNGEKEGGEIMDVVKSHVDC